MDNDCKYIEKCNLCASDQFQKIYIVPDRHYGIEGNYNLVKCKSCGLVFMSPMPNQDIITQMYPEDTYYSYQEFNYIRTTSKSRLAQLLLRHKTKDPFFKEKGNFLDIGCGSGAYLQLMQKDGWKTYGVEINQKAALLGKQKYSLNIFGGELIEANFPDNFFDYIRLNHSFEHLLNPDEVLDEIYRIIKPRGKLLIGVPNISGLASKIFGEYWWYLGAPLHPFNYSEYTLKRLLEKHKFSITNVTYNSDFHGLLGSFQIFLNRNNGKISSDGFFVNNRLLIVAIHWFAKIIDFIRLGDCIEITAQKVE